MLDKVCSRSNFSTNIFCFIQQYFRVGYIRVHFHPSFCLLTLRWVQNIYNGAYFERSNVFFHNQNTKNSIFKHRPIGSAPPSLCFGKIKSEICVNIYPKSKTLIRNISLRSVRSSTLNSFTILLKYPWSLLLFTHCLVFALWVFSSSESISSFKMITLASARVSTILNFWRMNGL